MTSQEIDELAAELAAKANECCYRSDGYEEELKADIAAAMHRVATTNSADTSGCAARRSNNHPGEQADCDWPFCGCDEHANKVIEVLTECGYLVDPRLQTGTPSSRWAAEGQPDPHGNIYDCERAELTLGHLTDDELANAAFMNYDRWPPLQDVIDGKAHPPIAYMTAVKERIRWLSRKLVEAASHNASAQNITSPKEA